jgi:lipooligosaccharide transport system permease protein
MFSGTFFEVARFPWFIQVIAWILPMTHLVAVVRPLTAGLALDPLAALGHVSYLAALAVAAFSFARLKFGARLFG